jgi:hypothetical protein
MGGGFNATGGGAGAIESGVATSGEVVEVPRAQPAANARMSKMLATTVLKLLTAAYLVGTGTHGSGQLGTFG